QLAPEGRRAAAVPGPDRGREGIAPRDHRARDVRRLRPGRRAPPAARPSGLPSDLRRGRAPGLDGRLSRDGARPALLRRRWVRQVRRGAYAVPPGRPDDPAHRHDLRGRARKVSEPPYWLHGGRLLVAPLLDGSYGRGVVEAESRGPALPQEAQRLPQIGTALLRGRGRREVGARGDPPTRQRDHLLRERRASLGPRLPRQHPRAGHPRGPERRVEAEDSLREHPAALRADADGADQVRPLSRSRQPARVAQYSQARNIEGSSGRIEAWASISPRESGLTSPSRSASLSTRALSGR